MIECPSCGMPVKPDMNHCSACGEAITGDLIGARTPNTKRTSSLDAPPFGSASVIPSSPINTTVPSDSLELDAAIPATRQFGAKYTKAPSSNGEPVVQTCLRCNSVINPAARFCSVCGRAVEPTAFERTVNATRSARSRAGAALRRAVSNVREQSDLQGSALLAPIICTAFAALCWLYSLYLYLGAGTTLETATPGMIGSIWWLLTGVFLLLVGILFKRSS